MFKKTLQVATAFGLLLAGYVGYVQAFALLAERLTPVRATDVDKPIGRPARSRSEERAIEVAVRAFGHGHWATDEVLGYRYYNADRGYWIYTRDYKRSADGKQLEFSPFALVWEDRDGPALKTVISDSALLDLDKPLGLVSKPGGEGGSRNGMKVVRARIEGNVLLRDDKGTPATTDDLRISFPGPVPSIEYDEAALEIRSDSTVVVEDRDARITGEGLLISLRPREAPPARSEPGGEGAGPAPPSSTGFNGAQRLILNKNIHIVIADVGTSGILPGNSRPSQREGGRTPLELRCSGMMQIDLPRAPAPVKVGPPEPEGPTIAQFFRNVEVIRGGPGEPPDRLDCDQLHLTLAKTEKAPKPVAPADPAKGEGIEAETEEEVVTGPLRELGLKRAVATGHNIQITSASQGVKARCKELIHKKRFPEDSDATYLSGDPSSPLIVEKTDIAESGPNAGRVMSFTTIRTMDATLFDNGKGNDALTIVARGPGEMESRPAPDRPVERSARWSDQLSISDDPATAAKLGLPALKKVTLTGRPGFADHPSESELTAKDVLVVWLKPKAPSAAPAGPEVAQAPVSQSFEINRLVALKDVRLTSPGKTLTARDRLDAVFETAEGPTVATTGPSTTTTTRTTGPALVAAATPTPTPTNPNAPAGAPARPAEPDAQATARRVWALVKLQGKGTPTPAAGSAIGPAGMGAEVAEVRLRGGVVVHQEPSPGKSKGVDVTGEAVDLSNQGPGALRFAVFHYDPADAPKAVATASSEDAKSPSPAELAPPARVETDELTIVGNVIGLDQKADEAWVDGRGSLTQLAARGLLADKGLANPPAGAAAEGRTLEEATAPVKRVPMTISWADGMKFFGKATDPNGKAVARAEFYKDVEAETEDATLSCATLMRTYLDKTVSLARNGTASGLSGATTAAAPAPDEPKADISLIECIGNVVVVNQKSSPNGKVVDQKQRIEGNYLLYNKATGRFDVPGTGQVVLYEREGASNLLTPGSPTGATNDRRTDLGRGMDRNVLQVADRPATASNPRVVGRAPGPLDRIPPQRGTVGPAGTGAPRQGQRTAASPPLIVTQVKFRKGMTGRFGTGKLTDKSETRRADFFGDIEVIHGPVADADSVLDPDRLPRSAQFMTSQILRVISEPKPPLAGQPDPPPVYLLRAWENAVVTTDDKTITADTITFDSEKQLFWAYGEGGRPVVIAQQEQVGLGFSTVTGKAGVYNHKTGAARLIDPTGVQLLDSRTGVRPVPIAPPSQVVKPRLPQRAPLRNPAGGRLERKSFNN